MNGPKTKKSNETLFNEQGKAMKHYSMSRILQLFFALSMVTTGVVSMGACSSPVSTSPVSASAVSTPSVSTPSVSTPSATNTVINVSSKTTGAINPLVFGVNGQWSYDMSGSWNPATQSFYPSFQQKLDALGTTSIRYPAGTEANLYHWKRAIGPVANREKQVSGTNGAPLDNDFGVDEYGKLTEQMHQRGDIVVNFSTGTPQEAADWVEYMTAPLGTNPNGGIAWAQVRAANGHPRPYPIDYWEVGNEMSLAGQQYWRAGKSSTDPITLYALGGTTSFTKQRVGKPTDYRDTAAVSDGTAGQSFVVKYAPVVAGSQTLYVGSAAWQPISSLQNAGPNDDVYTINDATGSIQFGDGIHGAIPASKQVITVSYGSGPHAGFDAFYSAMKAANPNIHVCAGIGYLAGIKKFAQVMGTQHPYDCMEQHEYVDIAAKIPTNISPGEYLGKLMQKPAQEAADVQAAKQAIAQNAGSRAKNVFIALTEYGHIGNSYPGTQTHFHNSLSEGLLMADNLEQWIQLGIPLADKSNLTGFAFAPGPNGQKAVGAGGIIAGPYPTFVPQSTALVLQQMSATTGTTLLSSSITNGPSRTLEDGTSVAKLTIIASKNAAGTHFLTVVNQDPESTVTAAVDITGETQPQTVSVSVINAPSYLSYNTPLHPKVINLKRSSIPSSALNSYTFPAHSITSFTLPSAK